MKSVSTISNTFLSSLVIAFLTLVTSALISRNYGASWLGEIGIFMFYCSIFGVINAIFGSSSILYVAAKNSYNAVVLVATFWTLSTSILCILLGLLFFKHYLNFSWLLAVAAVQSLYINLLYLLLVKGKVIKYNIVRLFQPLLLLLGVLLLLILKIGDINFYYSLLFLTYLLPLIYLVISAKQYHLREIFSSKKEIKDTALLFFKFGGMSQLINGLQLFNYRVSLIVIAAMCTTLEVGLMVLALTFVDGIWMYKNSVSLINYMETSQNDKKVGARDNILKLIFLSFCITISVTISVVLVPDQLYRLIFGKDFTALKQLILYMSPGILLMAASSPISSYFSGNGKVWVNLVVAVSGIVVFLPCLYIATGQYGLKGAALASNIPHLIGSLLLFYFYYKHSLTIMFKRVRKA